MDDLVTCNECGAAVPSGQQGRHRSWHDNLTTATRKLERAMQQARTDIQQLDAGVQRTSWAVHNHRH